MISFFFPQGKIFRIISWDKHKTIFLISLCPTLPTLHLTLKKLPSPSLPTSEQSPWFCPYLCFAETQSLSLGIHQATLLHVLRLILSRGSYVAVTDSWLLTPDSWLLTPDSWPLAPDSWPQHQKPKIQNHAKTLYIPNWRKLPRLPSDPDSSTL